MSSLRTPLVIVAALLLLAAVASADVTLVRAGQPVATIVLDEKPTKAAQLAAFELVEHVKLITGVELPVMSDALKIPTNHVPVLIGESAATRALGLKSADFSVEQYLVRVDAKRVVLIGLDGDDRGKVVYRYYPRHAKAQAYHYTTWPGYWDRKATLWAAYDFLENSCGVRWLNSAEFGTDYKPRKTLTVKTVETRRKPVFPTRNISTGVHSQWYTDFVGLWHKKSEGRDRYEKAAFPEMHKNFTNAHIYENWAKRAWMRAYLYRKRVGGVRFSANHSFYNFYPRFWEKQKRAEGVFVEKRPEWFGRGEGSLDSKGRPAQLCYTNPAVLKQVIADARNWFDGKGLNPYSGVLMKPEGRDTFWGEDYYALVPMDNSSYCKCAACQALMRPPPEEVTFANGMASELVWQFVNKVARALKQSHPDKKIGALAYSQYAGYPETVKLEDNIAVQFCHGIRMMYCTTAREREWKQLETWAAKEKGRPLFLWLYYCFPSERANRAAKPGWHFFPGFFAHTIADSFRRYRDLNVLGVFMNGYGHEVDAYVTFAMLDDPARDVDAILDEYFTRMYGPAGEALRKKYELIEKVFANPRNYPFEGHQNETVAWGFLGTNKRMARLAGWMDEARKKIKSASPLQQKRFKLYDMRVWQYLEQGKAQYAKRMKRMTRPPRLQCARMIGEAPAGDLGKVNWADALGLLNWAGPHGEGSMRKIIGHATHDGTHLYIRLEETIDPETVQAARNITSGDYWSVYLSADNKYPLREIRINPKGKWRPFVWTEKGVKMLACRGLKVRAGKSAAGWFAELAVPLDSISPAGKKVEKHVYLNGARHSHDHFDEPAWASPFGAYHEPQFLGSLALTDAVPADVPASDQLEALKRKALVALWHFDETDGVEMKDSSGNDHNGVLKGKAVRCESPFGRGIEFKPQRGSRVQYVEVKNFDGLKDTDQVTIEAWVWRNPHPYQPKWPPSYPQIVVTPSAYNFHIRPGNTLWLFVKEKAKDKPHYYWAYTAGFTVTAWEHVAAVYDGDVARLYINGREVGRGKKLGAKPETSTGELRIGSSLKGAWHLQLHGKIDEVAIYNRALPPGEIFARYRDGLKKVSAWKKRRRG